MTDSPPLDQRASFTCWTQEKIRFGDTDRLGHVNNAVFATLSEAGRVAFLLENGLPVLGHGLTWVIARLELDYRAELMWPALADIGTNLLSIGRSSLRIGQGMFWERGLRCHRDQRDGRDGPPDSALLRRCRTICARRSKALR